MSQENRTIGDDLPKTCGCCNQPVMLTPDITVVVVFLPALYKPYVLIPEHPYRVCNRAGCDSTWRFVTRACEAHEKTRGAGTWTRAIIVFSTGAGADVKNEVDELKGTSLFGTNGSTAKA